MEGIIKSIPFIVRKLDFKDSLGLMNLLFALTAITKFDFQYVILIACNDENKLSNALKVNFSFLKVLKNAYESNDFIELNKQIPPLPTEFSEEILDCFEDYFNIPTASESCYSGIDSIYTLLWEYSKYAQYLVDDNDKIYLKKLQEIQKNKVMETLRSFKTHIPEKFFRKLQILSDDVIQREKHISDTELNDLIDEVILISKTSERDY
jgi:hypothetical protein